MSSTAIRRIDKQLEEVEPGSLRHAVLKALRRFRSSWVDLGKLLHEVAIGGDYKEWGYENFELYCAGELGLKTPTVKKLIRSYNYMKSYEPGRLAPGDEEKGYDVPDYETVDLLKKLRDKDEVGEERKSRFHEQAFAGVEDETAFRKDLRECLRGGEEAADAPAARQRELQDVLRTARALRRKLAQTKTVPRGLKDRIEQALLELEGLD